MFGRVSQLCVSESIIYNNLLNIDECTYCYIWRNRTLVKYRTLSGKGKPFSNTVEFVLNSSEHLKKKKCTCFIDLNPILYLQ